jgi:hypothetical protein
MGQQQAALILKRARRARERRSCRPHLQGQRRARIFLSRVSKKALWTLIDTGILYKPCWRRLRRVEGRKRCFCCHGTRSQRRSS